MEWYETTYRDAEGNEQVWYTYAIGPGPARIDTIWSAHPMYDEILSCKEVPSSEVLYDRTGCLVPP